MYLKHAHTQDIRLGIEICARILCIVVMQSEREGNGSLASLPEKHTLSPRPSLFPLRATSGQGPTVHIQPRNCHRAPQILLFLDCPPPPSPLSCSASSIHLYSSSSSRGEGFSDIRLCLPWWLYLVHIPPSIPDPKPV